METEEAQLKDGSEWIDHEDCIVGNEAGLRNLIKACEVAIEKGEFYGKGLGDYVGVKKKGNSWFKNPVDSLETRSGNIFLGIFILVIVSLTFIGAHSVYKWLF